MKRNRRAGVEDLWFKSSGEKSARHGSGSRWRARYVDDQGSEHTKSFGRNRFRIKSPGRGPTRR